MIVKLVRKNSRYREHFDPLFEAYSDELAQYDCLDTECDIEGYFINDEHTKVYLFYEYVPVVQNTRCVGFAIIGINENKHPLADFFLMEFYVEPKYRNQGFANQMLDWILDKYDGQCCYFVFKDNDKARTFWYHQFEKREYTYLPTEDTSPLDKNIVDFFFVSPNYR